MEFDKPTRSAEHPTMKPVKLFDYLIKNSSKKGDIVLDNRYLSPIEIIPPDGASFDYVAKYQSGTKGAREICPAAITDEEKKKMGEAALKLHKALGLAVYSRTDFILDAQNNAWCLEVNTLPGMTPNSLIPRAARLAGLDYPHLCERIVELSLKR